jgi:hypothetical protein
VRRPRPRPTSARPCRGRPTVGSGAPASGISVRGSGGPAVAWMVSAGGAVRRGRGAGRRGDRRRRPPGDRSARAVVLGAGRRRGHRGMPVRRDEPRQSAAVERSHHQARSPRLLTRVSRTLGLPSGAQQTTMDTPAAGERSSVRSKDQVNTCAAPFPTVGRLGIEPRTRGLKVDVKPNWMVTRIDAPYCSCRVTALPVCRHLISCTTADAHVCSHYVPTWHALADLRARARTPAPNADHMRWWSTSIACHRYLLLPPPPMCLAVAAAAGRVPGLGYLGSALSRGSGCPGPRWVRPVRRRGHGPGCAWRALPRPWAPGSAGFAGQGGAA